MYSSYLVVLFYCHFIWFYLTCLNLINGDGNMSLHPQCMSTKSPDVKASKYEIY